MTRSKEERQAEQAEQQQAIEAQNTQENAAVPPNADVNNPIQTVATVTPAQAQADARAQGTVQQNIDGDRRANQYNDNLKLLKRIVGKASPIVEDVKETEEGKDANGNTVQTPVFKKVTKGYTYYAVDGKKFEDWVDETFNGTISIDKDNNKIIYNEEPKTSAEQEQALLKKQQEQAQQNKK